MGRRAQNPVPLRPRTRRSVHSQPRPLVSVEEAAELLGQSRSSLYRSIARGDLPLPLVKINGRNRIPRMAVDRLVAGEVPRLANEASEGGSAVG